MNPNVEIGPQADLDVDLEIPDISIKIAFGFPLQRVLPRRALKNPKGPIGDFLHQQIRFQMGDFSHSSTEPSIWI